MEKWGFCGPSVSLRSPNASVERTINWFPVLPDSGVPKKTPILMPTPGLLWRETLGSGPIRGMFEQDGRAWAISGGTPYELFANAPAIARGSVAVDGRLVDIDSNGSGGHQLLIRSAGKGYVYDLVANTVTLIADPDFPTNAIGTAFMDGYGLALDNGNEFFTSALEDFTAWDPLDVNQRSEVSDQWKAIIRNHREVWLFGTHTTNVYTDTGDPLTPFQPVPGVLIEQGILAPQSVKRIDNSMLWLGGDERGGGVIYLANGYTPQRISTHGVEFFLQQSQQLPLATAFTYQHEGHSFYQLHVPDLETSWVYDVATHLWHERALWDPNQLRFVPHRATSHCFAFGQHLVGDRLNGGIYRYQLDQYVDQVAA